MNIRFVFVGTALAILLIIVVLASLFLPRKTRLWLYAILILGAAGVWGYVTFNLNFLPSAYALEPYASGLNQPVFALFAPGDNERFFVVEKPGTVVILRNGVKEDLPFLDITDRVVSEGGEQGLLSLAFHPDFQQNGLFYVYYTLEGAGVGDTVLERFQVSAVNPNIADPDSRMLLLQIEQPNTHHNGGLIAFGPDGYLYVGVGEADSDSKGVQDLSSLWGTMLRLDVDGDLPYAIPPDNPFVDVSNARPEIWSYGLRNPWRFAFDPQTAELYIADVGGSEREEINIQPAGEGGSNYGWRLFEGTLALTETYPADLVMPVAEYDHKALGGCSIIGGYVYRGQTLPDLQGKYLFGDFCTGFVWTLTKEENGRFRMDRLLRREEMRLASFALDAEGEIYALDVAYGIIYKLVGR
jgi:glucose/arabinose dehydrogenase